MPYTVQVQPAPARRLRNLARDVQQRITEAIRALGDDPRPPGCRRLRGEATLWRIRIGDYRVVYTIDDSAAVVIVVVVGHRSSVYHGR